MANDNLRQALQQAGLTAEDLAGIVEVDARTVRRWLTGTTPYPRQRGKVARALDTTEQHLWPEIAIADVRRTTAGQPTDLVAGYTTASDLDAPNWKALMRDPAEQIELLGDTLGPMLTVPGVVELLAAKAAHGCEVRILVSQPGRHLVPFLDRGEVAIRVLEAPAHQTIYRFDEQLLLILHLLDRDDELAPLLHIQQAGAPGLFDRLSEHYRYLWEDGSQPIDPNLDTHGDDEDDHEHDDEDDAKTAQQLQNTDRSDGTTQSPAPPPRRWPRRPT
jgi:phosphoglycolate phosphatase-like HAD superfamily hydrolase